MIDRATVDKIIDAARIVDVVGEFVTLKKAGVNYKGLCPFHDDRNPSFMVSPAKNICHCFVCGKGGTPVKFLMEHEQITYPEALRWLAKKYNIEIVEKELTDEERAQQNERESMFVVNEWARDWFHQTLKNDPDGIAIGKQYFRSRGIRDDIIERFQLGYSPQRRDALAQAALKKGFKAEFLVKTGLCYSPTPSPSRRGEGSSYLQDPRNSGGQDPRNSGGQAENVTSPLPSGGGSAGALIDRYRGRAIFPWLNISGKVVAFGGRVLDSRTKGVAQKYVNSPDSDIYHKERELYGIYQAKKAIVKEDRVFMVEGYTDVIAMHQAGIENVVANSGTALSVYQIRLLHRFTPNITLLYDGDEAGIHAAMRGTDMLLAEGMNIKVLLLPDGDDPDSFAKKHSAQEFKDYIAQNQTDFITFKTRLTVENVNDPVKRSEAISGIVKSISVIPDQILRSTYLSEVSQRMGIKEQTLLNSMNGMIRKDIEDKEKERERAANRSQGGAAPDSSDVANQSPAPMMPTLHGVDEQTREVERLIAQMIVRHGDEVVYDNVETDEGQTISLTVAQYIDYDLGQDGILFHDPLYNQLLSEAVAHSGEPGFKAEAYFMQHPDIAVSSLAAHLAINRHQLGRSFQVKAREGSLRQQVLHLVLDLRMDIVEKRLKEIQTALRQPGNAKGRIMELMQELKDTQELRNALARRLGNDLVV